MRELRRVKEAIASEAWAIMPEKLDAIMAVIQAASDGEISAAAASMRNEPPKIQTVRGIPIVPIVGVIAKRMDMFHAISGGTSIDTISRLFDEALAMKAPAIIMSIDSPGGSVAGIPEFASRIHEQTKKPGCMICAYADGMAASAAYWIGSQADLFVASEAAVVGSIGVIAQYVDDTRRMKNEGLDPTIVRSSELKAPGAGPMSPKQEESVRATVNKYYGMFKDAVVRGRPNIDIEAAATGETWIGSDAVKRGLVDDISTLDRLAAIYEKMGVDK